MKEIKVKSPHFTQEEIVMEEKSRSLIFSIVLIILTVEILLGGISRFSSLNLNKGDPFILGQIILTILALIMFTLVVFVLIIVSAVYLHIWKMRGFGRIGGRNQDMEKNSNFPQQSRRGLVAEISDDFINNRWKIIFISFIIFCPLFLGVMSALIFKGVGGFLVGIIIGVSLIVFFSATVGEKHLTP